VAKLFLNEVSYKRGLQQKKSRTDRKRNVKRRRLKYGKNRNGFSSLKENWTGSTGSSG
jgi:hypothetical protein